MANYPSLNNNPIVQAIIEFKFDLPSNFDIMKFKNLTHEIGDSYPKNKLRVQNEFTVKDNKGNFKSKNDGFVFSDKYNHKSFSISTKQFDFFQSKPYDSWENLISECSTIWNAIIKIAGTINLKQVSTRFINRIEILNKDGIKIDDYFKTFLHVSDQLDSNIDAFFIRYSNLDKNTKILSHINLTIDKDVTEKTPFLLDIDVLTTTDISQENLDVLFKMLREKKDEIFFKTLTQKTLNLIQ